MYMKGEEIINFIRTRKANVPLNIVLAFSWFCFNLNRNILWKLTLLVSIFEKLLFSAISRPRLSRFPVAPSQNTPFFKKSVSTRILIYRILHNFNTRTLRCFHVFRQSDYKYYDVSKIGTFVNCNYGEKLW